MLTKYRHGLVWLCMLCISISTVFAQKESIHKKWYALLHQGVVFNQSEVQVQPGIAGGFQYKGYGAGLAASFDFIDLNSLQLSLDCRKSIAIGNQYLFVYANPGLNIAKGSAAEIERRLWRWNSSQYTIKNGYYLESGAGMLIGKKKNLLAGVYWSRKTHSIHFNSRFWNPVTATLEESVNKEKYELNRLGIQLGFLF